MAKAVPRANIGTWILVVIPSWIAFAIFLAIGPELERSVASILSAKAPSLYAAAFGESLIRTPSFLAWMFNGFDPSILLVALIVTLFALSASTPRRAALRAAFSAVVLISIADIIFIAFLGDPTPITEAVIFDVLGGPLVWLFFVLLFLLLEGCRTHLRQFTSPRFAYAVSAVILSTIISAIAYGFFNLFYLPGTVSFIAMVEAPTEGVFVVNNEKNEGITISSRKPMSIISSESLAKRAFITSPGGQMEAHWKKTAKASRFRVQVTFYADCPYPENVDDLPKGQPSLTFNADDVAVALSRGNSQFVIGHEGTRSYKLQIPMLAQYWLKGASGKPIDSIAAFVSPDDKLAVNPGSGVTFYLGGPLSSISNHSSRPAARQLAITVDDQKYVFRAGGKRRVVSNEGLRCRPLKSATVSQGKAGVTYISSPGSEQLFNLGALVRLTNEPVPVDVYQIEESTLAVTNANGWIEFFGFDFDRMTNHELGRGRGFSAARNVTRLIVDGEPRPVANSDNIFLIGRFEASYDERGVQLNGTASALWQNGRRLNPTLWERLSGLWQIPLLTALLGLLGLAGRWLMPRLTVFLGKDQPLVLDDSAQH